MGTDGTIFPPNLTPNTTIYLYKPELCRSVPLVYQQTVVHQDIETYRFTLPADLFDTTAATNAANNRCLCPAGYAQDSPCPSPPVGVFNLSACTFGSPLAVSRPHFLYGDQRLLDAVRGLEPDKSKHDFYIDMQPKLAVPLTAKVRLQMNLLLTRIEDIRHVAGLRDMVFPILWFESVSLITTTTKKKL